MSTYGRLFDVERFSIADGPGIRTVAFFKGCNMRCAWCHNPEGLSSNCQILWDSAKCIGCGLCTSVCSTKARRVENDRLVFDRDACAGCFRCTEICPAQALEKAGGKWSVEELCNELSQDLTYYRQSGGGITLSGGEAMCQRPFVVEVLKKLREMGIHTALETNLCFPFADYEEVLPLLDLLIFDIKHADPARHFIGTGVGNELILENAARLSTAEWAHLPLIVHTPIVPGFNDTASDVAAIAALLVSHTNLQYYELLSYHPLGVEKCLKLGMPLPRKLEIPSNVQMQTLADAAGRILQHVRINGNAVNCNSST